MLHMVEKYIYFVHFRFTLQANKCWIYSLKHGSKHLKQCICVVDMKDITDKGYL